MKDAGSKQALCSGDELRLVSVLFADLKGFTALSEQLPPDEVKEIIEAVFHRFSRVIEDEQGLVLKYEGDCVMAVFGMERSSDIDPINACYAALRMQKELGDYNLGLKQERGFTLGLRIGIHTGQVVAGNLGGRPDVLGDAVNTAARLEQHAPVGGIMVSAAHAGYLRGRFILEKLPPISVKGKSTAIPVFLVHGRASTRQRTVLDRLPDMVGRDDELKQCFSTEQRVAESAEPHLLLFTGPPGCGKSRLINEYANRCETAAGDIRITRCCFNSTVATDYHLFKVFLMQQFGVETDEDVYSCFRETLPGLDNESRTVKEYAAAAAYLTGFKDHPGSADGGSPQTGSSRLSPEYLAMLTLKAFEDLFSAVASETLHVLLVDDLHWADEGSMQVSDHLLRWGRGRILFLCAARPEQRDHSWSLPDSHVTIRCLDYFDDNGTALLLANLLPGFDSVPAVLERKIRDVTDGNPLFIEEIVIALHENGIIRTDGNRWSINEEQLTKLALPSTVEMAIQARLDRLSRTAVAFMKTASVMGRTFWPEAAIALLGPVDEAALPVDWAASLDEARVRGLIQAATSDAYGDCETCIFSHETIRDVAYHMLTGKQRKDLHGRLAAWMKANLEAHDGLHAMLCHHYHQAGLRDETMQSALLAGGSAFNRYQMDEAIRFFTLIKTLFEQGERLHSHCQMAEYLEMFASALRFDGRNDEFIQAAVILRPLAKDGGIAQGTFNLMLAKACEMTGEIKGALKALDEAARVLQTADSAIAGELSAKVLLARGGYFLNKGRNDEAETNLRAALEYFEHFGEAYQTALCMSSLGILYYNQADFPRAMECELRALEYYRATSNKIMIGQSLGNIGVYHLSLGKHEHALDALQQSLDLGRETGHRRGIAYALGHMGMNQYHQDNYQSALGYLEQARDVTGRIGDKEGLSHCLRTIGMIYKDLKQFDQAWQTLTEAISLAESIGDIRGKAYCLMAQGSILRERGEPLHALETLHNGLNTSRMAGDENAAANCLLYLGAAYRDLDRIDEARQHFEQALAIFRRTGPREKAVFCQRNIEAS